MEFRLLGPVEVWSPTGRLEPGRPRQRAVLAALLVDAGRPVMPDTLLERVWGADSPAVGRRALHVHITRIRRVIDEVNASGKATAALLRRSGGYVLEVEPDRVDLHRYRAMVAAAREPGCTDRERAGRLWAALGLWQGDPLADVPGEWAERVREGLLRERLDAVLLWAEAQLRLRRYDEVIGYVPDLIAAYPLAEPLAVVLMRALAGAGREAEALDCYATTRARLVEELGTEPGQQLRDLHQEILARGDEASPPTPAQLPLDVRGFAGRSEQLARLNGVLEQPDAVVVAALSGSAGVGKSALAVHWAHRVKDRYPDGQLYVNLRGFDAGESVTTPAEAVRGFLEALGVTAQRMPSDPEAQILLYRSLLAGRRVLVLLDNARDAAQVRPLLPGSPGCLAVVTSRNQLGSLAAAEGAYPFTVDLLPAGEARQLLANRLGEARVRAEPDAVDEIVARCARLPLALAVVAARAAAHPHFPLAALARELREARLRLDVLDVLDGGDEAADVRAAFSWSYQRLSHPAAQLFRQLGLHPGPDLAAPAAASLAGRPVAQVRRLLTELTRAHLLTEYSPGRFAFHDLLRAYAGELARTLDGEAERHEALRRVFDHYLHTAYAASLLEPKVQEMTLGPARPGVAPEPIADRRAALAWFSAEHRVLLAAIRLAADTGFDPYVCGLAWTLSKFLDWQGHWLDLVATQRGAMDAARRLGDRRAEAVAHRLLGGAYTRLRRWAEADETLCAGLRLFEELSDRTGLARTHVDLCTVFERQGRYADAIGHAEQALALHRSAHSRAGEAYALNALGWCRAQLGDYEAAIGPCREALTIFAELDDRRGQANTWDSLGYAYQQLGRYGKAMDHYRRALDLSREFGGRYLEGVLLARMGDVHEATGAPDEARAAWQGAYEILHALGHPRAQAVRAQLDDAALQPQV